MAKILLIEDDASLASQLKTSLSSYAHQVDHVSDGAEGLYWLTNESYDIAIVDWNLPGLEGPEICRRFRANGGRTPLLMLTGKTEDTQIVQGLDAGADDYLPKPLKMDILRARLRALLRRQPSLQSSNTVIGDIEIDHVTSECLVKGQVVKLTRKEFAILQLLMRESPQFFTCEQILRRLWSSTTEVSPDSIKCHITRMKSRLSAVSPQAAQMITSSYGFGYKIEES